MADDGASCARCGAAAEAPEGGLPPGWSLTTRRAGADAERLCAACTRAHVRAIEAKLDEEWW
ncbi:MAG TPA: hypothetical protein VFI47_22520 [Acidimicrobiales bacterium]|nr:hypothetical protein [Acidimicrobiales bacterium]